MAFSRDVKLEACFGDSQGRCQGYRRRCRISSFRPVEDITEEDLENVAITVRDKIYDKVLVSIM